MTALPGQPTRPVTRLSVNLNKVALLRNSRGGGEPDIVRAAIVCLDAGAAGLTLHPRPDARHARADDVLALARLCRERGAEFNLEGNPFAPPRAGYPGFLALCERAQPHQATLVPDGDDQLTSDHGFDFVADGPRLREPVAALRAMGCRVSLFADADAGPALARAADVGADRIELYTGPYAEAHARDRVRVEGVASIGFKRLTVGEVSAQGVFRLIAQLAIAPAAIPLQPQLLCLAEVRGGLNQLRSGRIKEAMVPALRALILALAAEVVSDQLGDVCVDLAQVDAHRPAIVDAP